MAVNGWRRPWSAQPFGDASASPLWIARKLVGAWGFDGSLPGRNIADSPGLGGLTGSNATRTGSPYGAATALNGSSAYLTNTANSAVTQLPVTFFARVYIGATKPARIFDISTGTTANDVIGIQQNNTGLRAQHYDGSNEGYAEIVNAGNIGRWITVAAVFDALASRAIYVDGGDQVATNATSVVAPSGINRVTIGYAPWGSSEYFNGTVSHALLFASALTAAEIKALHLDTLQVLAPRRIWVPVSAGGSDIDIAGVVGNAVASGVTGAPGVSIEIASAVGNAVAAGVAGSAQVATEIAGSVGNAVAAGVAGSASVTNDINIDGIVGNAVAAGVAGDTSVGSDISISGTVGNAVAAGTAGVPGVSATIAAAVGNATATGVSGLAAIGVVIDGSVGNAAAAGITGTLTLDIVVAGVVANAVAAGVTGSASVDAAAVSATPGYTIAAKARRLTITAAARRLEIRK